MMEAYHVGHTDSLLPFFFGYQMFGLDDPLMIEAFKLLNVFAWNALSFEISKKGQIALTMN